MDLSFLKNKNNFLKKIDKNNFNHSFLLIFKCNYLIKNLIQINIKKSTNNSDAFNKVIMERRLNTKINKNNKKVKEAGVDSLKTK